MMRVERGIDMKAVQNLTNKVAMIKVENQARGSIMDQVYDQVRNQVLDQVMRQVRSQVWSQVWIQVMS